MPSEETLPVFILVFLGQLSTQVVGGAEGGGGVGLPYKSDMDAHQKIESKPL